MCSLAKKQQSNKKESASKEELTDDDIEQLLEFAIAMRDALHDLSLRGYTFKDGKIIPP